MDITMLLISFAGGAFGTFIGGTTAFIFTGILALLGIGVSLSTGNTAILDNIAFGPFFGPHVAFAGAAAGAAFAGKLSRKKVREYEHQQNLPDDDLVRGPGMRPDTIEGQDTLVPLYKTQDPSVLIVGGIFGVAGYLIQYLYGTVLQIPIDTVALTVATICLVCRFAFGESGLTGVFPEGAKRFDMGAKSILFTLIWGLSLGALTGYASILLNVNNIAFAISAISLIFFYFGLEFSSTHHVSMVAGFAAIAFGNIWIAALFGMIAALTGEYVGRLVNTNVDTHVDREAITISFWSFIILGILS